MKRRLIVLAKAVLLLAVICLAALGLRAFLAPDWHEPPVVKLGGSELDGIRELLEPALMNRQELAQRISTSRFILVGETHFKKETVEYFLGLLDDMGGESFVILLELPQAVQPAIDRYMQSGDVREFNAIWGEVEALPLHEILRWAYSNRENVRRVVAMDEDSWNIFMNRAFLTDTRNESMTSAMLRAAVEYPSSKVVAYGGAMHMMLAGRYRFDVNNRQPSGMRLLESGISRDSVTSISLMGTELPIAAAWPVPSAVALDGTFGLLPYENFYEYPVYGVSRIRELHTHVVFLGPLTRQESWISDATSPQ